MNFNVIKKNRKYFAATTDNNKSCKILIDECSKDLELGEHFLAVIDISVRSKYGTDLIYKLAANVEEQTKLGICSAFSRDSGARIETGIALLSGYCTSGGSKKRWTTVLSEGATLRLKIPVDLLNIYEDKKFQVKTI